MCHVDSQLVPGGGSLEFRELVDDLLECLVHCLKCFLVAVLGIRGTFANGPEPLFHGLQFG